VAFVVLLEDFVFLAGIFFAGVAAAFFLGAMRSQAADAIAAIFFGLRFA